MGRRGAEQRGGRQPAQPVASGAGVDAHAPILRRAGQRGATDPGTLLESCLAGTGIAQIKAIGIQDQLDRGQLIDLFPDWPDERFPLYALYPSRQWPPAKVRAFIEFVVEVLKATPPG
jgi:DNA-binding transcriptional LysR family regulator